MARLLSILLWTAVFLLILLGIDQFLLRMPATAPAHVAVASFYRDLRSRLLALTPGHSFGPAEGPAAARQTPPPAKTDPPAKPPASIEAVIDQRREKPALAPSPAKPVTGRPAEPSPATDSIETVIGQRQSDQPTTPAQRKTAPPGRSPAEPRQRYLYADERGTLHFAATLSEIPEQYRSKARRLTE